MSFASENPASTLTSVSQSARSIECRWDECTLFAPINSFWCLKLDEAKLIAHAETTHNRGASLQPEYTLLIISAGLHALKSKRLQGIEAKSLRFPKLSCSPKVLKTEHLFLPVNSQDLEGHGSFEYRTTQSGRAAALSFFPQTNHFSQRPWPLHQLLSSDWGSDTCASTVLVQSSPPLPLSPRAPSLWMRTLQTAADRRRIKTDQMEESFRAADGQKGGRVKGSCLIIQGSSLIASKSAAKKRFLIPHQLKNCFL